MKRALTVLLPLAAIALSAAPAWSADSATVSMSVTPATACIQLNSGSSLSFGTMTFSAPGQPGAQTINPGPEVQNCSSATTKVFGRGTNASNGTGANWSLGGVWQPSTSTVDCSAGNVDKFDVGVATTWLSTADQQVFLLSAGQKAQPPVYLVMPCTGSSGAGTTMNWSVILTAAF
jgi:hypothetical protein